MRQLNYHPADAINCPVQHRHDYVLPPSIRITPITLIAAIADYRGHFSFRVQP
jgi:hypothetical protein